MIPVLSRVCSRQSGLGITHFPSFSLDTYMDFAYLLSFVTQKEERCHDLLGYAQSLDRMGGKCLFCEAPLNKSVSDVTSWKKVTKFVYGRLYRSHASQPVKVQRRWKEVISSPVINWQT